MIKGAIFDMDGLLFDTERMYQQTWQELAEELGVRLDGGFLRSISGTSGAHLRHVIEEYYHVADGSAIQRECMGRMQEKLSSHVPLKEGVRELLDFLEQKGIRMAVASSSAARQVEANLEKAGICRYFSAVASGEEVRHGKPAPDIFLCAARRIGCEPEECLVFEDSENGIRAGSEAGCLTVMVPDLMEASPEIRPFCWKICKSLQEAKDIMQSCWGKTGRFVK